MCFRQGGLYESINKGFERAPRIQLSTKGYKRTLRIYQVRPYRVFDNYFKRNNNVRFALSREYNEARKENKIRLIYFLPTPHNNIDDMFIKAFTIRSI